MGTKARMGQIQDVFLVDESDNNIGSVDSPMHVQGDISIDGAGTIEDRLKVDATQIELYTTFNDMLKELKKINLQLAMVTDSLITNQDVEV